MKRWILLAAALLVLVGAGTVLLSTRQAPDVMESTDAPVPVEEFGLPSPSSDLEPVKRLSTEEFRALGAEVMKSLPNKNSIIRPQVDDSNSPALIPAGVELAKIAEAVTNEPALEAEAVTLYRECATSPQYPDSVRALCFSNYKRMAQKTGSEFNENLVGKSIRTLADKLDF